MNIDKGRKNYIKRYKIKLIQQINLKREKSTIYGKTNKIIKYKKNIYQNEKIIKKFLKFKIPDDILESLHKINLDYGVVGEYGSIKYFISLEISFHGTLYKKSYLIPIRIFQIGTLMRLSEKRN
jgi:hypothetical protein